jgi:hypothetical protein
LKANSRIGTNAAAAALTILLFDRGYTLEVPPGGVIAVRTGETRVEPFMLSQAFRSGELTAEAWRDTCAQLGIAGIDLGRYIRDRQAIATHHQRGSE